MKRLFSFILAALIAATAFAAPSDVLLFSLPAPTTRTNVEVIDGQVVFAPGALAVGDEIQIEVLGAQDGPYDASNLVVRFGQNGTTSDPNFNAFLPTFLPANNHSTGVIYVYKILSNTSMKRIGGASGSSFMTGLTQSHGGIPIPDISTNTLYLSVAVVSKGATDPVALQGLRIRHLKP
jgi:hypothetical protein